MDELERNISDAATEPIENSLSSVKCNNKAVKELENIISSYDVEDAVKAVFCINAWADNRSAVAQTATINQAICNINTFGNKSINKYSELIGFFNKIKPHLQITIAEDLVLNDFGEVKIVFNGETYPVILGTGHEHVYAVMRFLPVLAEVINRTEDLCNILNYNRYIIDILASSNTPSPEEDYNIQFELPPEQFWETVNKLFCSEEFTIYADRAFQVLGHHKGPIELRQFFIYEGSRYPLYNVSILVDLYRKFLSTASEEEHYKHIDFTIGRFIENAFNLSDDSDRRVLMFPIAIDKKANKLLTKNHFLFAAKSKNSLLIAIYKHDFDGEDITKEEIRLITTLHKNNELRLCETHVRDEFGRRLAYDIPDDITICIILVEPYTDITSDYFSLSSSREQFSCTALDLIYMLCFINNFDELHEFIEYYRNEKARVMAFGGKSDWFLTWMHSNHYIASGAVEYNFISLSYGIADKCIYEYFDANLIDYPFSISSKMFSDPFFWRIKKSDLGYLNFDHKGYIGFGGAGKMIGSATFLFLAHNVEFFEIEDISQNNQTAIMVIDDLNQRLFNRYGSILGELTFLQGKVLQILYMPMHYAIKVDNSGFTKTESKKYVYSDIFCDTDTIIIRYTVKSTELLSAIEKADDRSVECAYFVELLEPLRKYIHLAFCDLERMVLDESPSKKEVGVSAINQEYYFDVSSRLVVETHDLVKARKEIAKICLSVGASHGVYYGKEATKIVRKMQTAIVRVFEEQIADFDKYNLHVSILEHYATQLHESIIHMKRYYSFSDLTPDIQEEFETKTREYREINKRNLRTAQYLLESNLAIQHKKRTSKGCNKTELKSILAFADWLVALQDNADVCHFTASDVSIEIDHEYRVNTIANDKTMQQYEQILLRRYNHNDYPIKDDEEDEKYFIECIEAFQKDTGIEFSILISLIEYLQLGISEKLFAKKSSANVFTVDKECLICDFEDNLVETKKENKNNINKALNFITLDCNMLKYANNAYHSVLPIWEREKRDNRFDVKPMIQHGERYIFSPVTINWLSTLWKNGFFEWYLPFEIGLDNVKAVQKEWKRRYEKLMVYDIAETLKEVGFKPVYMNVELLSRFPKSNFPAELGDYDIFAVNQVRDEIWLIESKVLQKVGSVHEDQMQQNSFFFQNRYDEKFQRRIDYIINNLGKVKCAFKLIDVEYTVIPYMVTNKLFVSRYKEVGFPIVSYHEFIQIISA